MLESFMNGLLLVLQWPSFGFLLAGIFIGLWFGAVPGLGGIIGLVLLLPFTFGMDTVSAMALLIGMYAVTSTSDTIASILLGVPGTAASQATILDGYPLAQKGQAGRALGAAYTVSAFGGVLGAFILAVSLPVFKPIILLFGSPELFMLGMLGLSMVGTLSGKSIIRGLIVALVGLLLTTIGYDETEGIPRYWFGSEYLIDGLPIVPVVLGFFALPELMELAVKNVSISRVTLDQSKDGGMLAGIRDALRHWWLGLKCSLLGTYIGVLPGLGPAIVDWMAYGYAKQSAKDSSQFGKGDIRGIIAPESANNASKAGALIPVVGLGIPGSLGTAILMGALIMQGLRPGPDMLTDNVHITFSIVWSLVLANLIAAGLLMIWSKQVAKIAFCPGHLVVPGALLFVFMGAWLSEASMGDWVTCLTAGILGYVMKCGGWPRPPLVLALILGNILENAYVVNMKIYQGFDWLGRPITATLLAVIILSISYSVYMRQKKKREVSAKEDSQESAEENNAVFSLAFTIFILLILVGGAVGSLSWPRYVRHFPLAACLLGIPLGCVALFFDWKYVRKKIKAASGLNESIKQTVQETDLFEALRFFSYLIVMLLATLIIGQKLVLVLMLLLYVRRWGGYSWKVSSLYAVCGWVILVVFYDRVMHIHWHYSYLSAWLPPWFPAWLIV